MRTTQGTVLSASDLRVGDTYLSDKVTLNGRKIIAIGQPFMNASGYERIPVTLASPDGNDGEIFLAPHSACTVIRQGESISLLSGKIVLGESFDAPTEPEWDNGWQGESTYTEDATAIMFSLAQPVTLRQGESISLLTGKITTPLDRNDLAALESALSLMITKRDRLFDQHFMIES